MPNSAHILWTSPLTFGGLAGGQYGGLAYYQGASYEQFFQPPVIMNGILYYNTILAEEPSTESTTPSITAIGMVTGQNTLHHSKHILNLRTNPPIRFT